MGSTSRRRFLERVAGASLAAGFLPLPGERSTVPRNQPPYRPGRDPLDEREWRRIRAEFLPGDRVISLNSANMSPAPRSVVVALDEATRLVDGDVSYQNRARYAEIKERARARLARMVGAGVDEVALVRNASEANNIVVSGIDLGPGDEVLLFDQNHPTNNVAWDVRAARAGFRVRRISMPSSPGGPAELLDHFTSAASSRTRVVAFSYVSNVSGLRLPATEICRWARERDIHSHVDGAQTFAAMALDLSAMGCDSFAASAQKWLMGPREMGFLFVREAAQSRIWPSVVGAGWGNTATPAVPGAQKLEVMGQRNDATVAGLDAALAFQEAVGHERIVARTGELASRLAQGLERLGLPLVTPSAPDLRLAVLIVQAEAATAREWHDRLYREHGVISSPTGGLRFSPCVCVTLDDIDRAVEAIAAVTRRG